MLQGKFLIKLLGFSQIQCGISLVLKLDSLYQILKFLGLFLGIYIIVLCINLEFSVNYIVYLDLEIFKFFGNEII